MTSVFNENGDLTPVTVLQAGPCVVTQVKTVENDGYSAVQVGFEDIREKLVSKGEQGVTAKAGLTPKRFIREFKVENTDDYKPGQEIKADVFAAGDHIDVRLFQRAKASGARSSVWDSTEAR
jgi:large subunit ribosomal protein L3